MRSLLLVALVTRLAIGSLFSNNIDETFKLAQKKNLPIMISFNAIWCPPCNDLEETVYESTGFLERSRKFQLLQVDADAPKSWKLKNKYKVGGYPTVIFVNAKGDEIYRFVGYREPEIVFKIMDLVSAAKGKKFSCKGNDAESLWWCAVMRSEQEDTRCAVQAYQSLQKIIEPNSARGILVQTYFAKTAQPEAEKKKKLEALMSAFPESAMAPEWASEYVALKKQNIDVNEKLLSKILEKTDAQIKDPTIKELGLSQSEVLTMKGTLLDDLDRSAEARSAWKQVADYLETLLKNKPNGSKGRAINLEYIYALRSAEEYEKTLKISSEFQKLYPEEFTFHFLSASSLSSMGKNTEAFPVAKKAYEFSYGDNKIRAATLLVKPHGLRGEISQAEKIFGDTKQEFQPGAMEVRTHRYLKQLEEQWSKVKGQ